MWLLLQHFKNQKKESTVTLGLAFIRDHPMKNETHQDLSNISHPWHIVVKEDWVWHIMRSLSYGILESSRGLAVTSLPEILWSHYRTNLTDSWKMNIT